MVLSGVRFCQVVLSDMLMVEIPDRVLVHSEKTHRILVTVTGRVVFITLMKCSDGRKYVRDSEHL